MNTRNIKAINFWTPVGIEQADTLMLYNFHGYNFDGTASRVSYKLGRLEEVAEGQFLLKSHAEGSVSVPDAVVQSWGQDDECIFDHVISVLNLETI